METFIISCWVISFALVGLFFYRSIYIAINKESKVEKIKKIAKIKIKSISDKKYVTLLYSITDTNGKELDSKYIKEPFTYLHGGGQILAGLEKRLTGLKLGTKKKIVVPANEAYGERNPGDINEVEKSKLGNKGVEVGSYLEELGDGVKGGTVVEVKENTIIIDSNHPLAGKKLVFNVDIIDIQDNADSSATIDNQFTEDVQMPANDIAEKNDVIDNSQITDKPETINKTTENELVADTKEANTEEAQEPVKETITNDVVVDNIESKTDNIQETVNKTITNDKETDITVSNNDEKRIDDITKKIDELDNQLAEDEQKDEKEPLAISDGMEVKLTYAMFDTDGNMIESKKDEPLTYVHGSKESFNQIIPGLQKKMSGLTAGSSVSISLLAEEAYGKIESKDFQEVNKDEIFTDDLRVGIVLKEIGPHKKSAKVHEIKESTVILDFNHQLAGKALSYNVNILDVKAKQDD